MTTRESDNALNEERSPSASNRQRRLLEAVSDLPEPWQSTRPWRSESEAMSRHLAALRSRLDWLVVMEERHGNEQRAADQNRAERNALIFVLREFAEQAGIASNTSSRSSSRRKTSSSTPLAAASSAPGE